MALKVFYTLQFILLVHSCLYFFKIRHSRSKRLQTFTTCLTCIVNTLYTFLKMNKVFLFVVEKDRKFIQFKYCYNAYSPIRTRWARFFCKHVQITKIPDKYKKLIFSYNNITAAFKRKCKFNFIFENKK